jgi:hypothetical protein
MLLPIRGKQLVNVRLQKTRSANAAWQPHSLELAFLRKPVNYAHAAGEAASGFFAANHTRRSIGRRIESLPVGKVAIAEEPNIEGTMCGPYGRVSFQQGLECANRARQGLWQRGDL